jgi:hypothetical protein
MPACRAMTLPVAHERAAPSSTSIGTTGALAPWAATTTPSPTVPIVAPTTWRRDGASLITTVAMTMVKMTCAWSTSDASPAGMPRSSEMYSRLNCARLMNVPIAITICHDAWGRGTKNTSGNATSTNRIARNSSGGTSSRPSSMTTKLSPQISITRIARRLCLRDMTPSLPDPLVKHQQRCVTRTP